MLNSILIPNVMRNTSELVIPTTASNTLNVNVLNEWMNVVQVQVHFHVNSVLYHYHILNSLLFVIYFLICINQIT